MDGCISVVVRVYERVHVYEYVCLRVCVQSNVNRPIESPYATSYLMTITSCYRLQNNHAWPSQGHSIWIFDLRREGHAYGCRSLVNSLYYLQIGERKLRICRKPFPCGSPTRRTHGRTNGCNPRTHVHCTHAHEDTRKYINTSHTHTHKHTHTLACLVFHLYFLFVNLKLSKKRLPGLDGSNYTERLAVLGLDSLELRRLEADLCTTYKVIFYVVNLKCW